MKEVGPQKSERSEFENEIYQQGDLSKNDGGRRENLMEKGNGNLKSSAEIFEKSEVGKTENLMEVGPQKSERSEFENEIYQQGDLSKNDGGRRENLMESERQIEIER